MPRSVPAPVTARPPWLRRLVAATSVLLAVSACSTSGADEGTRSAGQSGYVGVDGNVTLIAPEQRVAVPTVTGESLDGKPLSTADYAGKVVVVNVWGSWCAPCRKEAPDLQAASEETRGVAQFLGITVKDADASRPQAFVRTNGVTYPSIFNPTGDKLLAFSGSLPPSAIPSTLVVDREGRLAARILGPISERSLVTIVRDVAAG